MTHQSFASSNDTIARSRINERMVPNIRLIWLDINIDKNSINDQNTITQFRRVTNTIETFTDRDQCIDFLTDTCNENVILIISDALCRSIVPLIHDVTQLHTIFIFCENEARYERWAKGWPKINDVFTQVTSICQGLEKLARESKQNAISISVMDTSGDVANKKLDQLDSPFMYTQILKEILLTINFEQIHFQEFIQHCRDVPNGNSLKLKDIEEFEQKYHDKTPIWWYTRKYFLYSMLNHALRLMDVKIILKMGFFVRDLHHDIERLHSEQFSGRRSGNSFTVYRGQRLSKADFDQMEKTKGGLLSFNNFLSTSKTKNVSSAFADPDPNDSEFVGVLFVINVDPSKSTTPFASISNISHIEDEDEVLFSMHSVFRIQDITPDSKYSRLYQVNLTLTCNTDEDLRVLTDRIREETFPNSIGWDRLGQVLLMMGHSDKAQQVYDMLLEQSTNKSGNASIYHQLGLAKYDQGKYGEAIEYYEKSLAIKQKRLSPNHPYLAVSYNNIGNVYGTLGNHPKALWFHEKALEIQQQFFPPNHPDLAKYYNNIGLVYGLMSKHLKALWFHEKALEIRQQSLPPNHPDLASSYNNVGGVYDDMEKYLKALSSFEKALEIRQRSLPPNHPDLANSYNDIGNVYGKMQEFEKALSFFETALQIQQKSLSSNHPELAKSYSNIGLIYEIKAKYLKAQKYYELAVKAAKHSLPSNHPNMILFKKHLDRVNKKL
jgi:tetratricopeptide (TPR) repeat protein